VDAPSIHHHRLKLGGHAGLEDALLHALRNADPVIDHGEQTRVPIACRGDEDPLGMSVACIAQHLDDDILEGTDVVLCLPTLSLRDPQANKPIAKVLLDFEVGLAGDGRYEIDECVIVHCHASQSTGSVLWSHLPKRTGRPKATRSKVSCIRGRRTPIWRSRRRGSHG